jgi:hypothetical protein
VQRVRCRSGGKADVLYTTGSVVMIARGKVSGRRDSNPRPSAWEADALPTELLPHRRVMAICADVLW